MNVRPVLVSGVALLVVAAGIVALLPVELATHQTSVDGVTGSAVAPNASADFDGPVAVYVEGPGWSSNAVSHFLVGDLRAAGIDADVVSTLDAADGPVLAVRILDLDTTYRPVSPTASVRWRFVYTTTANTSYVQNQLATAGGPSVSTNETGFVVEGEYTLRDDVDGVISIPAYREAVADRVAATTAEKLLAAS